MAAKSASSHLASSRMPIRDGISATAAGRSADMNLAIRWVRCFIASLLAVFGFVALMLTLRRETRGGRHVKTLGKKALQTGVIVN